MTKKKEKKEFNREYIPVLITGFIFVTLIGALACVFLFNIDFKSDDSKETEPIISELNVDIPKNKCSTDTLKKLQSEVKKIEIVTTEKLVHKKIDDTFNDVEYLDYNVWNVELKNMTDNFYIKVTNNKNDEVITVNKDNLLDGKWAFDIDTGLEITTYTISVISTIDSCNEQVIKKLEYTPMLFNYWYGFDKCSNYPEFEYCKKYINKDAPGLAEFMEKLDAYISENPEIGNINPYDQIDGEHPFGTEIVKENDKNSAKNEKSAIIVAISAIVAAFIVFGVAAMILFKKNGSK